VLSAMGLSDEEAHSSLRITLGRYTTEREIKTFVFELSKLVSRLRAISNI
jgi:cysteine desulfurase